MPESVSVLDDVAELRRLFAEVTSPAGRVGWVPRADIYGGRDAVVIRVEVPGVGRDHLRVVVAEGECIVRGERLAPEGDRELRPLGLEFPYGSFERRFALPAHADADTLTAKYADGVLEVRMPVRSAPAPREKRIEIA